MSERLPRLHELCLQASAIAGAAGQMKEARGSTQDRADLENLPDR